MTAISRITRRSFVAACAITTLAGLIAPGTSLAATRKKKRKSRRQPRFEAIRPEAINTDNPLQVLVSISDQELKVYSGTRLVGKAPISSGTPSHPTPHGIFTVMDKRKYHRSNIYSNAPMPYMQRLTWSGIALHEGRLPGRPASHGCVRLPKGFARQLFRLKTHNRHVIINDTMPEPAIVRSNHLFNRVPDTLAASEQLAVVSDAGAPLNSRNDGSPLRIYLTRHTGRDRLSRVQTMLNRLGFEAGPADGLMGRKTWHALASFQKSANMRPTGTLSGATIQVLEAAFGVREHPAGHLYVRQDQKPVFDMPVSIKASETPLGTHLFTADSGTSSDRFEWTAVSLGTDKSARSALAALERFDLSDTARKRIEDRLTPFSSIAISDLGLGQETGKGTDFIVVTR